MSIFHKRIQTLILINKINLINIIEYQDFSEKCFDEFESKLIL